MKIAIIAIEEYELDSIYDYLFSFPDEDPSISLEEFLATSLKDGINLNLQKDEWSWH